MFLSDASQAVAAFEAIGEAARQARPVAVYATPSPFDYRQPKRRPITVRTITCPTCQTTIHQEGA